MTRYLVLLGCQPADLVPMLKSLAIVLFHVLRGILRYI
jgi:hypothetical protein